MQHLVFFGNFLLWFFQPRVYALFKTCCWFKISTESSKLVLLITSPRHIIILSSFYYQLGTPKQTAGELLEIVSEGGLEPKDVSVAVTVLSSLVTTAAEDEEVKRFNDCAV